ncbi:Carbamoyl-phosphate synthase small chain, chloroplastic [Vitis vinifera]|uniref:carbamoyl-phosphate synthase (glutamine-hydrolyzing) n=1 Tax=Vitis vinifera TaxID=29760 RepID=A0A438CNG7_VITVI|nr:Carbamoyl-phosphate synthase small chain, chloroplastic [Vitis vinifera]
MAIRCTDFGVKSWFASNPRNYASINVRIFTIRCSSGAAATAVGLGERPWKTSDARLVLEDGSVWKAKSFGASGTQVGEVVFNTSLTGYQEILTDPSYAGQFVLMTNPHIGNTGINFDDEESSQCFLAGLVIRSLSISTSNWRCAETLGDYLAERNIMGIYDVDTRAITRRLRQDGSLIGVLSTEDSKTDEELLKISCSWDIVGVDLISGVSCNSPYEWVDKTGSEWDFNSNERAGETFHVIAYDFGIKHNILRRLASYGCKITVVPSTWPASETLKMKPDGVLFSNGPGDPSAVPYAVETVKEILGKVPVFGICMGHQLLGQALGGKTFKMKLVTMVEIIQFVTFGVVALRSVLRRCVLIDIYDVLELFLNLAIEYNLLFSPRTPGAPQFRLSIDPASLPEGVEVTHVNLNDGSCAGLAYPALNIMSLQYHPEASPGPHDSDPETKATANLSLQGIHPVDEASKAKCLTKIFTRFRIQSGGVLRRMSLDSVLEVDDFCKQKEICVLIHKFHDLSCS